MHNVTLIHGVIDENFNKGFDCAKSDTDWLSLLTYIFVASFKLICRSICFHWQYEIYRNFTGYVTKTKPKQSHVVHHTHYTDILHNQWKLLKKTSPYRLTLHEYMCLQHHMTSHVGQYAFITDISTIVRVTNSYSASCDNWCTVGGDGGCRVGEVRAGTTSPMLDHKGFKLQ